MTDPMMKKIMIHGVESFTSWIGNKYQFSYENYDQIRNDVSDWIAKEFEEMEL